MADDEIDLDAFRERLLALRDDLEAVAETNAAAAQTVELDQQWVGRVSRMDALQQQAMGQESERRRNVELRKISSALARIDSGDFGYCLSCDEQIAIARLEFDPAATLCIECAKKAE